MQAMNYNSLISMPANLCWYLTCTLHFCFSFLCIIILFSWVSLLSGEDCVPLRCSIARRSNHSIECRLWLRKYTGRPNIVNPLLVQRHFCPINALHFFQPESSVMASSTKSDHDSFDSERVLKLFQGCKAENGDLSIDCYNDAYEELCK